MEGARDVIATWLVYGAVLLGLVLLSEIRVSSVGQEPTVAESPHVMESLVEHDLAVERPEAPHSDLLTQRARIED